MKYEPPKIPPHKPVDETEFEVDPDTEEEADADATPIRGTACIPRNPIPDRD